MRLSIVAFPPDRFSTQLAFSFTNVPFLNKLFTYFEPDASTSTLLFLNIPMPEDCSSVYFCSVITQSINGIIGGTYTLSGYVQGENIVGDGGVGVQIMSSTGTVITSELVKDPKDAVTDNGFTRVSATISLAEDESITCVQVGLIDAAGIAYIDSLQLEEGEAVGPVNLLENSSFEQTDSTGAIYAYTAGENMGYSGLSNNAEKEGIYGLVITSDASIKRKYTQDLAISGKAGDAYTFGAWAKAYSTVVHDDNKPFAMTLTFHNTDGKTTEKTIDFNTAVNEWQFASQTALAEKDYNSLSVALRYENNVNTSYFDCTFLYRDTAMSYTYNEDGNVVSTKDFASQNSEFEYTGNNLSKVLDPTGTGYEYYNDDRNNLIGVKSSEGTQQLISNDSTGKPVKVRTISGVNSAAIQANETYYIRLKESGKYLTADNAGTTAGTNVSQAEFVGADNQKWSVEQTVDGYFVLHPKHATDTSLNVADNSDTDGANVNINSNNNEDGQKFKIQPQSDYTYKIIPKCSDTEKKISVDTPTSQNNVTLKETAGGTAPQSWYFENVDDEPANTITNNGVYRLRAYHSGRYMEVNNGSTETGTAVNQNELDYGENQEFGFTKYGSTSYYKIVPMHATDKLLSVSSTNSTASGNKYLCISNATVTDDKLFKLEYDSEKRGYRIIPKSDETKSLEVASASLENAAEIAVSPTTTDKNRYFLLEECLEEMESSISYTQDGNYVSSTTDERGNTTTYNYDDTKDLLLSTTNASGTTTSYTYDSDNDRLKSVASGGATVNYTYNMDGSINSITTPKGTVYNYSYDEFGRSREIKVGSKTLAGYTYVNNYSSLVSRYDSGNSYETYTYDKSDRLIEEYSGTWLMKSYTYDKFGNIAKETDNISEISTNYRYDLSGRLTGLTDTSGQKLNYVYDKYNRITHQYYNTGERELTTEYRYGSNVNEDEETGLIYSVSYDGDEVINYIYDDLNRLYAKEIYTGTNSALTVYEYLDGAKTNHTSTLVGQMMLNYKMSGVAGSQRDFYDYTYDAVGNIKSVSKNGEFIERYNYDSKNQMTLALRGTDAYTYTYDEGGNLTEVTENGVTIKTLEYEDSEWKDLLTKYNDQPITYNSAGFPLTYRDNINFLWDCNDLRQISINDEENPISVSFLINGDGLRSAKVATKKPTVYYTYIDDVLMKEESNAREIIYLYDEQGNIAGIRVIEDGESKNYYYQFNLQGDVIGILNENGYQVAAYTYDEWGGVLSVTGSDADGIGAINPIRYRGCYYDVETGFYYMNSRYYDPVTGRFITADTTAVLTATPMSITDKNLFAYCDNNPVAREDTTGMFWETVFDIASLCVSIADVCSNPKDPWAWAGLVGDVVDLVPFVTGAGEVLKGLRIINKADVAEDSIKAAKAASNLQEAGYYYGSKVQRQMSNTNDLNHAFPSLVDTQVNFTKAEPLLGGDGIVRKIVKVPGSINGRMGMYEYIIEVDGEIRHRFFKAVE